jgi:uncharacterized protein (TIGR02246 family)
VSADSPESVHRRFQEALESRDIEALTAIYEPEAVFVPGDSPPVEGIDGIRGHLEQMLASEPHLESETILAVRSGSTAMLRARWSLTFRSPEGDEITEQGESTEIVRLQPDGTWRCIIDCPHT